MYKTKSKDSIGPLNRDGQIIDSSQDMSEALNNYFVSTFTHENLTSRPEAEQIFAGMEEDKLSDISITREDVLSEIDNLKKTK